MKFTTIRQLSLATAVGITVSFLTTGEAQAYTFTKIADTSTTIPDSTGVIQQFGIPALNNGGTVAFWVAIQDSLDTMPWFPNERIFTGSGQSLTSIAKSRSSASFGFDSRVFINDEDTVAFYGVDGPKILPYGVLFISSGGSLSESGGGGFYGEGGLDGINNQGKIVSEYVYPRFKTLNIGNREIESSIDYPDLFPYTPFSDVDGAAIDDRDNVVFRGSLREGGSGIFVACDGSLFTISNLCQNRLKYGYQSDDYNCPGDSRCHNIIATIIDSSGPFKSFGNPDINNRDTVAFSAELDGGGGGIFTIKDGKISIIIDSSSPLWGGGSLAINDLGTVAFTGAFGIFTGLDPVADKVISLGDILFGYSVTAIDFGRDGFNNMGQIAFRAKLADGTQGIYRADPDPEPPKSVPESTSVLGLFTVGALALAKRRKS
ncbi:MAG TPA: hypothetical protein DEG17_02670 [Cyanobacteria bacterium UBA11149]|nr:hypothetical protein [Cyanobacteria bacterium UBA11367]HBE59356.1 hypothetical protein [Cyanobacteria bacterium UBA11366]HBK65558.1 hypothetical protein [Cyanobacteria bacterium UBA11166]HBR75402.1 hypothetical protein [Cyanobacteria bacterium UBA11159]HBS70796.1 hypothetical protein [Cyanobacteria bacterium UBA11153]HBW87808.1 hypothetical protein [Cyanobacteria bacterium UBA11149]HCA95832.1 hypothetical protein [Cyanobacteria bacterium UBA9226]